MLYFGGGPGCSSMMGTFINNGPCRFDSSNQSEPSLDPYSFNAYANVLYVGQPIPTGFSHGNGAEPRSTKEAAIVVYDILQAFYDRFPAYQGRDAGIFTSSYGGHYGPEFVRFILQKNGEVAGGGGTGHEIKVAALGLDNASMDAAIQERSNIEFAHRNEYRQLINDALYADLVRAWEAEEGGARASCSPSAPTPARTRLATTPGWLVTASLSVSSPASPPVLTPSTCAPALRACPRLLPTCSARTCAAPSAPGSPTSSARGRRGSSTRETVGMTCSTSPLLTIRFSLHFFSSFGAVEQIDRISANDGRQGDAANL